MVRLVDDKGEQIGVIPIQEALSMARDAELDLVEVAPQAEPPVCRIMDYGRYKYKLRKKHHQSRAKSHAKQVKAIRLSPKTGPHDIEYRVEHAREFLTLGHRVQINVQFKGREMAHLQLGRDMLLRFAGALEDVSKLEATPKLDGRRMGIMLIPKR